MDAIFPMDLFPPICGPVHSIVGFSCHRSPINFYHPPSAFEIFLLRYSRLPFAFIALSFSSVSRDLLWPQDLPTATLPLPCAFILPHYWSVFISAHSKLFFSDLFVAQYKLRHFWFKIWKQNNFAIRAGIKLYFPDTCNKFTVYIWLKCLRALIAEISF